MKARRRISSLIKEGKRSPLEVPQFLDKDVITLDRETAQLKKEVRRLGVTKVITKLSSL